MPVSIMDILHSTISHSEKAKCHLPKPSLLYLPLKRQKSLTIAWDPEKQVIGRNSVEKPVSQTKTRTEGNSICFSGLNDLRTIPSTLTETLQNKNYGYKSEQKNMSVKGKLKEKCEFLAKYCKD